jgi:uncharacterized alkaline shock family protein YloU
MSVRTSNAYGDIAITNEAVAQLAGKITEECYGVVEKVSSRLSDSILELFKKNNESRGVKVSIVNDRIHIDLYVILKFGMSISAVAESLRNSVKYSIENFTGMVVGKVNINVIGIKL